MHAATGEKFNKDEVNGLRFMTGAFCALGILYTFATIHEIASNNSNVGHIAIVATFYYLLAYNKNELRKEIAPDLTRLRSNAIKKMKKMRF